MIEKILDSLNDEQKNAVLAEDGPVLINAGAGSGKTRVLASRIALLLEQGVMPERILALTFTRKAAGEMRSRVSKISEMETKDLVMGTFHSVFVKFLRQYANDLGYPERFTIYDEDDSMACLKDCINEVLFGANWKENKKAMDSKKAKAIEKCYSPKTVQGRISIMKNNAIDSGSYADSPEYIQYDAKLARPKFSEIFTLYERRCKEAGAMDYDDILLNMLKLLMTNIVAFRQLAARFDYILVDEYQDTNVVQYLILKRLTARKKNICVVGDDSQSIYAFRGAKIDNILNFKNDFPGTQTFKLETNYRSTQQIVNAANRLIANNVNRLPKECHAAYGKGDNIRISRLAGDREEAAHAGSVILDGVRNGMQWQDYAILYRTNAQSRAFEDFFIRNKIPYKIYSGLSFYERMEVKDVLAFLKLAVNPNDNEAFKRASIKPSRGFGATSLSALQAIAARKSKSLYEVVKTSDLKAEGLKPKAISAIMEFVEKLDQYNWDVVIEDAYSIAKRISEEMGIYDHYASGDSEDDKKRLQNVDELLNNIASFTMEKKQEDPDRMPMLMDYLEDMALLSNVDVEKDDDPNKVSLMTVHSAKGLEFPYVFVVGAEESLFPSYSERPTNQEIEEERRLFYVAITRAQNTLDVCCAARRMRYGSLVDCSPSRFIDEMKGLNQVPNKLTN